MPETTTGSCVTWRTTSSTATTSSPDSRPPEDAGGEVPGIASGFRGTHAGSLPPSGTVRALPPAFERISQFMALRKQADTGTRPDSPQGDDSTPGHRKDYRPVGTDPKPTAFATLK